MTVFLARLNDSSPVRIGAFFFLIPAAAVMLLYLAPNLAVLSLFICITMLILFGYFLLSYRRGNLMIVFSLTPAVIGPLIAQSVFRFGGNQLTEINPIIIPYCFVWASIITLIGHLVLSDLDRKMTIFLSLCIIGILSLTYLTSIDPEFKIFTGPRIFLGLSAPDLSFLFLARTGLVFTYVALAVSIPEKKSAD